MTERLIILCCFVLSGCLSNANQARVTPNHTAQIKTVGIISLLNAQPHLSYLSKSAMESNFATAVLEGWHANRIVHKQLATRLKQKGFEVAHIAPNTPGLDASESDSNAGYRSTSSIHERLYAVGAAKGVDMLIVVYPHVEEDFVTKTNQNVRGYGLQRSYDSDFFAYAAVYIEALDVKKHVIVGNAEGLQLAPLNDRVWRDEFETVTGPKAIDKRNQATVFRTLSKLLTAAIGSAAREAGL